MAGIGFELKKIYKKEGVSHSMLGALYSATITVGPTIVVILTILLLYFVLGMNDVSTAERELLSSTILYVFIFSVSLDAPFNSVFSRYLSDKFYDEDADNILPSYYMGLLLVSALGMLMALPVMWSLYFRGGVDLPFILGAYVLWASAVILFFSITYLHATKDYKIIAVFFFAAMVIGALTAVSLNWLGICDRIHSIMYGLALGFFVIAFCEFAYIRNYFRVDGGDYTGCLQYLKKYKNLFFTNLFYILGLYIHNFVMWTTPGHIIVANTLVSHMAYDMASCLAMFSNISTTVIFTVTAETEFHETYQKYMEAVIGGTYRLIQKNKRIMFNTLSTQLAQIFSLQLAITCITYLFLHIFGLSLGFSSMTMSIYPVLTAAYIGVFMMYCLIVFLYYFDDTWGSLMTSIVFFMGTLIGMIFSKDLQPAFYGTGLFVGMFLGFAFAFFRLRMLERNFETHIFCRYKIVDTITQEDKGKIVYRKGDKT